MAQAIDRLLAIPTIRPLVPLRTPVSVTDPCRGETALDSPTVAAGLHGLGEPKTCWRPEGLPLDDAFLARAFPRALLTIGGACHPSGTYGRFDSARGAAVTRADSGAW